MQDRSDQELLREFVARRNEDAFAEMVRRHASLVLGTARRKVSDGAVAEEVTQVVFVALARKAAFLLGHSNLSGWLHRTALLEAQQFLRSDLRRRRREESAMKHQESEHPNELAAELDEALLELGEKDRQPLLLRFFEGLSLRDLGKRLAIGEDAAQKRVAKSLEALTKILRRRGREVEAVTVAAALGAAAEAAPAHLVLNVTQAALAGGSAAGVGAGIAMAFGKFMALTKAKTAVVCALALSSPLVMQTQQLRAARSERATLNDRLQIEGDRAAALRGRIDQVERRRVELRNLKNQMQARSTELAQVTAKVKPREDLYRWSDSSEYVRLPKSILNQLQLTSISSTNLDTKRIFRSRAIDAEGNLSPALVEALGLDGAEQGAVKSLLAHYKEQFAMLEKQRVHLTNAMPPGIMMESEGSPIYTLVTPALKEEGAEIKRQLLAEWERVVGAERAQVLLEQGRAAFDRAFLNFGQRERWTAVTRTGDGRVRIGRSWPEGGVSTGGNISTGDVSDLPEPLQAFFKEKKESNE